MALLQMPLGKCSRFLDIFGFRNHVRECGSREKRNDVYKAEFGMEVLSKVCCHLQGCLR
jgi:hypothetical protein